jgi:PHD/YefM family antitoxin component YafN of YafNO toxin-antitoxin module
MTYSAFPKIPKIIGVSEFRSSIIEYLRMSHDEPVIINNRRSGDSFVAMPLEEYNKLVESLEKAKKSLKAL